MKHWEDLALETAERFGGTMPHPETAATIQTVYQRAPNAVERAIDRVALEYEQGAIRSPWGVLKSRVAQITTEHTATRKADNHERLTTRAEQWIRTAGVHFDRETEILDELFGDRGPLREHPQLQTRMVELWRQLRPLGETVELEQEQRLADYADRRNAS